MTRLTLTPPTARPLLDRLIAAARNHVMTAAERQAQRRSWVLGELMLAYPEMTRGEADAIIDKAMGAES